MDSAGETVSEGEGFGRTVGRRGRAEGEADTDGADITVAVARAVGAGVGEAGLEVARAVGAGVGFEIAAGVARAGDGVGVAETAVVGVVTGLALTAATVAVVREVLDGTGFTNVFEGASSGGVTSAFIFARARSAAGRSVSAAQLFSTVASVIVSFTVCGRSIP